VGIIRKTMSVSTLGMVSYRSNSERSARANKQSAKYAKQSRNAARAQVAQNGLMLDAQRQQLEATYQGNGVRQAQYEDVTAAQTPIAAPVMGMPAGWYQDPQDPTFICYWNGQAWDSSTRQKPVTPPAV